MNSFEQKQLPFNPRHYFIENDFESSQLISISYDPNKKQLLLVLRFAKTSDFVNWLQGNKKPDSPTSDFRLLVFENVEEVSFQSKWIKAAEGWIYYNLKDSIPLLIDYFKLEDNQEILINLTSSSRIRFRFRDLLVQQRFGRAVKKQGEDEWDYFDSKTGQQFDFFNPFNLSLKGLNELNSRKQ